MTQIILRTFGAWPSSPWLFADLEEATVAFGPQVARRHEPDEARTRVLADAALWFERLSAASARPDRVDEP